jgi:hypothetical protein
VHLDDLRHVCLDFLSRREILISASISLDHIGSITVTGNFPRGGGRREYGFEGLQKITTLSSYSGMTDLKQKSALEQALLQIVLICRVLFI